jgi:hypothetical protein
LHSSAGGAISVALGATRREFLYGLGATLGAIAFNALLRADQSVQSSAHVSALASRAGHMPAKAKSCIFLMMEGGPSHIDTFDPKPKLAKLHLQEFMRQGTMKSPMESGKRYFVASPFRFRKAGRSGADIAENWEHLAQVVDDICFYRGCQVDSVNHPTAMYQMNTGNRFGGDPAIGAWVTYGLGTPNQDLPAFIVLPELAHPQGGAANWSHGFLPPHYQGNPLRPTGTPILHLNPMEAVSRDHQRENLALLATLNTLHFEEHPQHEELAARMHAYELAFRMQSQMPELLDIRAEPQRTLEMFGIGKEPTDAFGRKCLLARRLVERGVRFVQLYAGTWDSHDYIARAHSHLIRRVDQPIAALLTDLQRRGLLESTLVIWCGEFGRSPDNGVRGGTAYGRDHNPQAMTIWFAGGGVNAGHTIGATDELGAEAIECVHHVRDLHVTILRLLGLDDSKLTYFHAGRFKQLSQFGGKVIDELIA